MANKKSNTAMVAAAVVLVACMTAVASTDQAGNPIDGASFCAQTNYRATCEKSIAKANSSNPKDLIKAAFDFAMTEIESVIKSSAMYKKVKSDRMTAGALEVCEEVLDRCIFDLKRSFDKVDKIEVGTLKNNIGDLRNWKSATVAHKETCIDAFRATSDASDIGKKVRYMLHTTSKVLSNALAMVTELEKILGSVDLTGIANKIFGAGRGGGSQRQLLGDLSDVTNDFPEFVDSRARKLLQAEPGSVKPDITVAQDGSGQFKTITEAITKIPLNNASKVVLIKAGLYEEYVSIPTGMNHLTLIGEGPLKTIISGNKSFDGGVQTFSSGALLVSGESFIAKDLAVQNTINHSQAVAMRINGDMGVFQNVHFNGYQDTLYAHSYRQFFRDCLVSGTIDYIFGDGRAIFQHCDLVVRTPLPDQQCMVTAQGRTDTGSNSVLVIQNCHIKTEQDFKNVKPPFESFLGRPWKNFSRTIIMQSDIDGFIDPAGWAPWSGDYYLDTLYYAEWDNRGAGADTSKRVGWPGLEKHMDLLKAQGWTAEKVFVNDDWIKTTGVPYVGGMMDIPK